MPTYDYRCGGCGAAFDALRAMAERDEPAACPACGGAAPRVFASAPRLACMDRDTRAAIGLNERAAFAPRSSADAAGHARLRHPAGCGCCAGGASTRRGATVTAANGAKAFPSKRPWMISH